MDRLRISENQRTVHKISKFFKRLICFTFAVCLLLLSSCNKNAQTVKTTQPVTTSAVVTETEKSETVSASQAQTTTKDQTQATTVKQKETTTQQEKISSEKTTKPKTTASQKTSAKTSSAKPTQKQNEKYCFLTIECKTVLKEDNFKRLETSKQSVIPSDGVILKKTKTSFDEGDSVYDVFKSFCQNNVCTHSCRYCQGRIQFESVPTAFGTYIKGIHFLYEKDCGTKSGWMYKVNGVFPDYSVDLYTVKENDDIVFVYTCDLGDV